MLTFDPFRIAAAHKEFWNNQNATPLKELLAPQATYRIVSDKEERPYLKAAEENLKLFRTAFPDLHFTYVNIIPTPSTLAIEWTVTATHTGMFRDIPPTGKFGVERGINILKLNEDGKIVKEIAFFDLFTMMNNLGVLPAPIGEAKIRELTRAHIEAFNHHDLQLLKSFFLPDHTAVMEDGRVLQAQEHMNSLLNSFVAFPDVVADVRELAIRGNEAVLVIKVTGTHKAPWRSIPATNRKVEFEMALVINWVGEKIRQVHYYQDIFTLLKTVNVIPEPVLK